jgi:hypothetical protein
MNNETSALIIDLRANVDPSMKKVHELINGLEKNIQKVGTSSTTTGIQTKSMFASFLGASVVTGLTNQLTSALINAGQKSSLNLLIHN